MGEQATEQVDLADEYRAFEQRAGALLDQVGEDAEGHAFSLVKHFRNLARQHAKALERARDEGHKQAFAELAQQRQTEAAYRRLGVPESARALFGGVDVADQQAMAQRAEELRLAGVSWAGQPQPPAPPPPDPNLASMLAMQQAEAGGNASGNGSLEHRIQKMAANPGDFSDEQRAAVIEELNAQVRASVTPSSGALG